jgi:hypothetical protein
MATLRARSFAPPVAIMTNWSRNYPPHPPLCRKKRGNRVWFLFFTLAHDWVYRFHNRWFRLSVERFDATHYLGMAIYKLAIFLFNLVPWLALHIVV